MVERLFKQPANRPSVAPDRSTARKRPGGEVWSVGVGEASVKMLGLIVNPIAGIGGRVGLKGSDGAETIEKARKLGALPEAPRRAVDALRVAAQARDEIELVTYPGEMGEDEARECGLSPTVVGSVTRGETTPDDTKKAALEMERMGADLVLFAGGDGTARDVCDALGLRLTALGIPAGVKIHSAVYAVNPRRAGELALSFLNGNTSTTREAEVMDLDEDAFRQGVVTARLYGYLRVPYESRLVQSAKSGSIASEGEAVRGIASEVVDGMAQGGLYVIGPGTTTKAIMDEFGLDSTLLGVDVVLDRRLIAADVGEREVLELVGDGNAKIVVSVIGGQGYILGRGNQQLSPEVLRKVGKDNIIVVATKEKLASLGGRPLLVDTGEEELDAMLSTYVRVMTGFNEYAMYRIGH